MRLKIATLAVLAFAASLAAAQSQGVSKNEILIGTIQDMSGPLAPESDLAWVAFSWVPLENVVTWFCLRFFGFRMFLGPTGTLTSFLSLASYPNTVR